jgi:hypothetical protein
MSTDALGTPRYAVAAITIGFALAPSAAVSHPTRERL